MDANSKNKKNKQKISITKHRGPKKLSYFTRHN